jgi:hypothetical protein
MVGAVAPLTAARGSLVRELAVGAARDAAAAHSIAQAADQGDELAAAFAEEAQELLGVAAVRRARAARMRKAAAKSAAMGLDTLAAIGADAALLEDREAERVEGAVVQAVRESHSPGAMGYVSPEEKRLLSRKRNLERMTSGQLEQAFHSMLTRMYDTASNYGAEDPEDEEIDTDDVLVKMGSAAEVFGGDLPAVFGDDCYGGFWDIFKPSKERLERRLGRKQARLEKLEAKLEELEDAGKKGLRVSYLRARVRGLEKGIARIRRKLEKLGHSAVKVAKSEEKAGVVERAEAEKVREAVDPLAEGGDSSAVDADLMAAVDVFGGAAWRERKLRRRIRRRRMKAARARRRGRPGRADQHLKKARKLRRRLARIQTPRGRGLWARRRAWARAGKPMAKVSTRRQRMLRKQGWVPVGGPQPPQVAFPPQAAAAIPSAPMPYMSAPPMGPPPPPMGPPPVMPYMGPPMGPPPMMGPPQMGPPQMGPPQMGPPPMPYSYPSYDEMRSAVAMPSYDEESGEYGYNVEDDPTFAAELAALEGELGISDEEGELPEDDLDLLQDTGLDDEGSSNVYGTTYPVLASDSEEAGRQVFVGFFDRRCAAYGGEGIDPSTHEGFGGFWENLKGWWSNLWAKGKAEAKARRTAAAARREARKPLTPSVTASRKELRKLKKERRQAGRRAYRESRGRSTPPRRVVITRSQDPRIIQDDGGWKYQQNPDGSILILEAPPGSTAAGQTYAPGSSVVDAVVTKFGPHPAQGPATVGSAATWYGPRGGMHRTWYGPRGGLHHVRYGPRGRVVHHGPRSPWARRRFFRRGWYGDNDPYAEIYGDDDYGAGVFQTLIAPGQSVRDKAMVIAKELDGAIAKYGPESGIVQSLKARLDDVHEEARVLGPDAESTLDEDEDLDLDEAEADLDGELGYYYG